MWRCALRIRWIPGSQSDAAGFQIVQGLIAAANGGVLGTGLGLGSPTLVPAVHTDFSIVAIVEEMGLAGGIAVLTLYVLPWHCGFRITLELDDSYSQLLAAGLTTTLGAQTLLILAGVLKLYLLRGSRCPGSAMAGAPSWPMR